MWPHWGVLTVSVKAHCSIEVVGLVCGVLKKHAEYEFLWAIKNPKPLRNWSSSILGCELQLVGPFFVEMSSFSLCSLLLKMAVGNWSTVLRKIAGFSIVVVCHHSFPERGLCEPCLYLLWNLTARDIRVWMLGFNKEQPTIQSHTLANVCQTSLKHDNPMNIAS